MNMPEVSVKDLHKKLRFRQPLDYPETSLHKPLKDWKMEIDDSPIFRYLYRNFRPRRHLEFGTWQGTGVLYCLEECDATVWTLNTPQGEKNPDGTCAYSSDFKASDPLPSWSQKKPGEQNVVWCQTDSLGFIGRYYMEAKLGHRVNQIYCDSRQWDISNYPRGFFDTALIDGGHSQDVVLNDTEKALQIVRSRGLIMWHDFCQHEEVLASYASPRNVVSAIEANWPLLKKQMKEIFWINPSWILLGIRK
jgi:hypothetical protein